MSENRVIITQCFEELAEKDVDIMKAVYAQFASASPDASEHMELLDERMRGRMLDQIYSLLLGDVESDYLDFETRTHKAYGATVPLYRGIFGAVKGSVHSALSESWSEQREVAWDDTIENIVEQIERIQGGK